MLTKQFANFPRLPARLLRAAAAASLLLCFAAEASGEGVEARLESSSVRLGETVRLVIESDTRQSAGPDLGVLDRDFDILGRQRHSSMSVINGQRRERHSLVLTLTPRRAGLLEIPPIAVGDAVTDPLQLAVDPPAPAPPVEPSASLALDAPPPVPPRPSQGADSEEGAPSAPVLLEASLEPKEARVAQQVLLIARVLMPQPVTGPVLRDPRIDGARLLPLGEDRDRERRSGRDYQVYERRYALFPERAGRLEIAPLLFEGWRQGTAESGYLARPEAVRAESAPLSMKVLPAAAGEAGQGWLPARSIRLTETGPETYQVRAGQPLERVLEIRADGVPAADLPGLAPEAPSPLERRGVRPELWDERTPNGIIGVRRERIRLTGYEPGSFRLPAVSLDWWDTGRGAWRTARLPARELLVLPAGVDAPATPPLFEPVETRDTWSGTADAEPPAGRGEDVPAPPEPRPGDGAGYWVWATLALACAWLLTMGVWWAGRRRPRRAGGAAPPAAESWQATPTQRRLEPADPLAKAIDDVRKAYESGEAGPAREALLAWAALALPEQPPGNLALLAKRCKEPLRGEILLLEQAFFSPRPVHWERRRVWDRLPGFEPLPPEEPASFRRKTPIRRRKPSPDTTA